MFLCVFIGGGGRAVPFLTLENKLVLCIPAKQTQFWQMPQETGHLETAMETV